jgi:hypothetical protein
MHVTGHDGRPMLVLESPLYDTPQVRSSTVGRIGSGLKVALTTDGQLLRRYEVKGGDS